MILKKYRQIAVLIILVLVANLYSCKEDTSKTKSENTNTSSELPLCDSIKPKGLDMIYCKKWFDKDNSQKKIVFFSKTRTNTKEEFFVEFFKENNLKNSFVSIYDFIEDCPVDFNINFIKDSFSITDIDNNGIKEISFLYELACQGGIGPIKMKSVLIEGSKKHLVRGFRLDDVSIRNNIDPNYPNSIADKSFKNAPPSFFDFSKEKWNKFHGTKLSNLIVANNITSIKQVSLLNSNIVLKLSNNQKKTFQRPYFIEDENPKVSIKNNLIIMYYGDDYGNSIESTWSYSSLKETMILETLKGKFPLKNKEIDNLKTCTLSGLNSDIKKLNTEKIYNLLQKSNNCYYKTM